jgi:hypothetical protein
MFRKDQDSYLLSTKKKKTKWESGSSKERVDLLNNAIAKGHEYEVRYDLISIDTEEDVIPDEVLPGVYRLFNGGYSKPESLDIQTISERNYPNFPEAFDGLDNELEWFKDNKDFFSDIGIRRSRSVLLWGPPGYSKTAKIHDLVLKNLDMLVIFMVAPPSHKMVEALNNIKLDKIIIFEEFATAVNNDAKISAMLNFLDGDNSLNDAFFIITTNHPEIIPRNVLRPSRIDKFIKIDKLSSTDIENFLKFYLKRDVTAEEITLMKGQSLANLREICISSLKESKGLADAIKLLKNREELMKKDFASPKKVGLSGGDDDDFPY